MRRRASGRRGLDPRREWRGEVDELPRFEAGEGDEVARKEMPDLCRRGILGSRSVRIYSRDNKPLEWVEGAATDGESRRSDGSWSGESEIEILRFREITHHFEGCVLRRGGRRRDPMPEGE